MWWDILSPAGGICGVLVTPFGRISTCSKLGSSHRCQASGPVSPHPSAPPPDCLGEGRWDQTRAESGLGPSWPLGTASPASLVSLGSGHGTDSPHPTPARASQESLRDWLIALSSASGDSKLRKGQAGSPGLFFRGPAEIAI